MGKIKLPKSLLRILFPKKKKKNSASEIQKRVVAEREDVKQIVASNNDEVLLQTAPSTSPTVTTYSNGSNLNIVSMQFSFDDYDDASYAEVDRGIDEVGAVDQTENTGDHNIIMDKSTLDTRDNNNPEALKSTEKVSHKKIEGGTNVEVTMPEDVQVATNRNGKLDNTILPDDSPPSLPSTPNRDVVSHHSTELEGDIQIITNQNVELNDSILSDDNPPSLPSTPARELPHHSSPSAQRARQKALARQKRILSKCEERLNALTGTADATLEEADKVKSDRMKQIRERQARSKPTPFNLDKVEKKQEDETKQDKQFSTIVFYESNQAERDLKDVLSPLSAVSEEQPHNMTTNSPNNVIDTQGFPLGSVDAPSMCHDAPIPFFILLLDPKSRIFELVEIDNADKSSSIQQVLDCIRTKCSDERLMNMNYIGLCRPSDRVEFTNLSAPAFSSSTECCLGNNECIMENDVLVAILQDSTGFQMCKISKPILKNDKFRNMIRKRRKGKRRSDRSVKSDRSVEIIDETASASGVPLVIKTPSTNEDKKEKYNTLCKKLESLSKKLHQVDGEIMAGEVALQSPAAGADDADDAGAVVAPVAQAPESTVDTIQCHPKVDDVYQMSPKMVATELAQHIEEIFADHDVEILAVDADDDDESDDGTFVSARSHKSVKSVKSIRAKQKDLAQKSRRQRAKNVNLFESSNDDALALQIEAMAVQAEEAFGSRHGKKPVEIEERDDDIYEVPALPDVIEEDELGVIPEEFESSDILDTMKSLTRGGAVMDVSNCTPAQKEAFSRNFLNTSTSMGEYQMPDDLW
eukprot:scaffold169324_cov73-Cyclotella_meneghiniana.AAC.4